MSLLTHLKMLGPKIFWVSKKIFRSKSNFCPNKFSGQKKIWSQKGLWNQKKWVQKYFGFKKFWVQKYFGFKKFWVQKYFGPEKTFESKQIFRFNIILGLIEFMVHRNFEPKNVRLNLSLYGILNYTMLMGWDGILTHAMSKMSYIHLRNTWHNAEIFLG